MIWSLTWATVSSTTLPPKGEVSALGSNFARSACCSGVRGLLGFFWARAGAAASRQPASSQAQTSERRRVMNLSTYRRAGRGLGSEMIVRSRLATPARPDVLPRCLKLTEDVLVHILLTPEGACTRSIRTPASARTGTTPKPLRATFLPA